MKLTYKEWTEIIGLLKSELRETESQLKKQTEIVNNLDRLYSQALEAENPSAADEIREAYEIEHRTKRHYSKRCCLLDGIIDKLENQEI